MFVHQEPVFNNKPTLIRYSQTYEQKELKDTYLLCKLPKLAY